MTKTFTAFKIKFDKKPPLPPIDPGKPKSPRNWQIEAFNDLKDSPYSIINAPMSSGKTLEICFLSAYKLMFDPSLRCIIADPQTIIANGFSDEKIMLPDGTRVNWVPHNFCNDDEQPDEGTVEGVKRFLEGPQAVYPEKEKINDRILLCTHATLVAVYRQLKDEGRLDIIKNLLLWVDEAHHVKNMTMDIVGIKTVLSNGLGELVSYLHAHSERNIQIGLATATFFRGDRCTLLTEEAEEKFKRYDLPYDKYLASPDMHLESFSFDFVLCDRDYTKAIGEILKSRKGKDIIYIPHPNSRHSTGKKYDEAEKIINCYQEAYGGTREDVGGLTTLKSDHGKTVLLDLVDEELRGEKKEYTKEINEDKGALDSVIALGMFKEGADWIWADRSIIVGARGSLVDTIQMFGRILRDAEGKKHVQVIQLLPWALDQANEEEFKETLNAYLKAVFASLILENVLNPAIIQPPTGTPQAQTAPRQPNWLAEAFPDETKCQEVLEETKDRLLEIHRDKSGDHSAIRAEYQVVIPEILAEHGVTQNIQQISDQIWVIFSRRTMQMSGQDVDDIDFEILKGVNPIGFLLAYTTRACGIETFKELRKAIQLYHRAEENKRQLLQMGKDGEDRPVAGKHPLGTPLCSYTGRGSGNYDAHFYAEIKKLRPDWFADTVVENKKKFLQMARDGEPRPASGKHPLGAVFCSYIGKKSTLYDVDFDRQIREAGPIWFTETAAENKKKLLEMPVGCKRPKQDSLGKSLSRYVDSTGGCYDSEFDKTIHAKQPQWFINTATEKKEQLLQMARNNAPHPTGRLSAALCGYTSQKSGTYDAAFDKTIRELRSDWWGWRTVAENKKELLEMAGQGEPRPPTRTPLGDALCRYTGGKGDKYDANFDRIIRELRPDWFVDTVAENKKKLLDMAGRQVGRPLLSSQDKEEKILATAFNNYIRNDKDFERSCRKLSPHWFLDIRISKNKQDILNIPAGCERPNSKTTRLGRALLIYTSKNRSSYDAKFDAEIREKQPQWFIDTAAENKKELLEMPAGCKRPNSNQERPGKVLNNYIHIGGSSYDPVFDRAIREKQPQWFIDTASENKKKLLALPTGYKKPISKDFLGQILNRYTTRKSSSYDAEFDTEIRKKQLRWFADTVADNKEQLLGLPMDWKRPNKRKSHLGKVLGAYTCKSHGCYDPEFDRAIRKRHPQWFK